MFYCNQIRKSYFTMESKSVDEMLKEEEDSKVYREETLEANVSDILPTESVSDIVIDERSAKVIREKLRKYSVAQIKKFNMKIDENQLALQWRDQQRDEEVRSLAENMAAHMDFLQTRMMEQNDQVAYQQLAF